MVRISTRRHTFGIGIGISIIVFTPKEKRNSDRESNYVSLIFLLSRTMQSMNIEEISKEISLL
jgi:hypothetical protein